MDSDVVAPSHSERDLELTILMPCLNEAETVGECVQKARSFLHRHAVRGEVLVSDNGSQDGSQEIARRFGARVVNATTRGYGAALIHGTLAARSRYVIMGDADGSYDFGALLPFIDELRAGANVVIGDRFRGGIEHGAMPWKNRWVGTPALSVLGRLFFHSPVRDFNCGLRAFSRSAFEAMNLRTDWHGVCVGDDRQSHAPWAEDSRNSYCPQPRWPVASAASSALARWLEALALPLDV